MWIGVERLLLAWTLVALGLTVIVALGEMKIADVVGRARAHGKNAGSDA